MADVNNVSYGKPLIASAIAVGPLGASLPTDATTKLDTKFKTLGYISTQIVQSLKRLKPGEEIQYL
jgi:hypothetical protein